MDSLQILDSPTPVQLEALMKNNQLLPYLINESESSESDSDSSDDDPMLGNLIPETQSESEYLECEISDREYLTQDELDLYQWRGCFY